MLVGAIAPQHTNIYQVSSQTVNLQNSNIWQITETTGEFNKTQLLKIDVYENTVIKIEQVKGVRFRQSESNTSQDLYGFLFTRITPKLTLDETTYTTVGNTQTYYDSASKENPYYEYEFYVTHQTTSNKNYFDNVLGLTSYDQAKFNSAKTQAEQGELLSPQLSSTNRTCLNRFGNQTNTYEPDDDIIVYMEYVRMNLPYFPNSVDFNNTFVWNTQYDFFYNQPYRTTIDYSWYINPETTSNYEVIDVGNLLLTILGMPMAWITQAFNFTLWPGTPYAINVGHVLSAVIIASVIIIIIKKVYK